MLFFPLRSLRPSRLIFSRNLDHPARCPSTLDDVAPGESFRPERSHSTYDFAHKNKKTNKLKDTTNVSKPVIFSGRGFVNVIQIKKPKLLNMLMYDPGCSPLDFTTDVIDLPFSMH